MALWRKIFLSLFIIKRTKFLMAKMAKFGVCGKVFDKVCTFWETKR